MHCCDGKGNRCPSKAEYRLRDDQGNDIPGAMCCKHAQEVIDEYAQKLGWRWTAVPIDELGRLQPGRRILYPVAKSNNTPAPA